MNGKRQNLEKFSKSRNNQAGEPDTKRKPAWTSKKKPQLKTAPIGERTETRKEGRKEWNGMEEQKRETRKKKNRIPGPTRRGGQDAHAETLHLLGLFGVHLLHALGLLLRLDAQVLVRQRQRTHLIPIQKKNKRKE